MFGVTRMFYAQKNTQKHEQTKKLSSAKWNMSIVTFQETTLFVADHSLNGIYALPANMQTLRRAPRSVNCVGDGEGSSIWCGNTYFNG